LWQTRYIRQTCVKDYPIKQGNATAYKKINKQQQPKEIQEQPQNIKHIIVQFCPL
jgi:hypothetical protein